MITFHIIEHSGSIADITATGFNTPTEPGWYAVSDGGGIRLGPYCDQLEAGKAARAYIIDWAAQDG